MDFQSAAQTDVFEHEKLKLGGNSIRLLTLRRGDEDSPIVGDITQYAIHRRPEYVALSYSWGSDDEKWPIILNGKKFLVRRNLFDCLRRLRQHVQTSLTLWVDALCIDQTDVKERNHIVQLMDQVYERALTVYVWLGEGDEDSDQAMQFLAQIDVSSQPEENAVDWFIDTCMRPVDYHQEWVAVVRLFMRPYWSRLWVIQETLLAPSIVVFCGQHRLSWEKIEEVVMLGSRAIDWYAKSRPDRAEIHTAIVNTIAVRMVSRRGNSVRFKGKRDSYPTLQELLESFKDSQCFDPRDEIFGLLSIAGDYYDKRIDYIDYNLRPTQVFVKFIKNYVDQPTVRPESPNPRLPFVRRDNGGDPLWNIRRLSDALRLNVDDMLKLRREDFEARLCFNDLAENPYDSVLTLPCQILYKFVSSSDTTKGKWPHCILRSSLGMFSSNSWSSADSEPVSPSITVYEAPEAQTKLKEVVEDQGYKVCDAGLDGWRPNTPVLESPHLSTSLKFFNRVDDDDNDPYVPHLSGIACPAARPGDFLVQTEESDMVFVVRMYDDGVYKVIGNAIMHEVMSSRQKIRSSAHKLWHHHYLHPLHRHHNHHHENHDVHQGHHSHYEDRDSRQSHHNQHDHHDHRNRLIRLPRHFHNRALTSEFMPELESFSVHFSPLMLLMIVSEPNWRQDQIGREFRGSTEHHSLSYRAIQPRGDDDPVVKNFGIKIFTASAHLNRLANQIRDRTAVALEELREMKHDLRET